MILSDLAQFRLVIPRVFIGHFRREIALLGLRPALRTGEAQLDGRPHLQPQRRRSECVRNVKCGTLSSYGACGIGLFQVP